MAALETAQTSGRIPRPVTAGSIASVGTGATETLKLERTLSDLINQACGLSPPAETELNSLQAALLISSWPGNPNAAPVLIWK